jgi:hypothetical protein
MLSKNMETLWNDFSDDEKSAIEARYAYFSDEHF